MTSPAQMQARQTWLEALRNHSFGTTTGRLVAFPPDCEAPLLDPLGVACLISNMQVIKHPNGAYFATSRGNHPAIRVLPLSLCYALNLAPSPMIEHDGKIINLTAWVDADNPSHREVADTLERHLQQPNYNGTRASINNPNPTPLQLGKPAEQSPQEEHTPILA